MQVEEVDAHLENTEALAASVDTSKFSAEKLAAFNFCAAFQVAKPILKFARILLFWKPKWQAVIDTLIAAGDAACPTV